MPPAIIQANLAEAECLLREPSAEHVRRAGEVMASIVAHAHSNVDFARSLAGDGLDPLQLKRIKTLLDAGLRLRLGLARAALAGLHGYSADGQAAGGAPAAGTASIVAVA